MSVSLSIVPDPAERSAADALSSQIAQLSELVDSAIGGGTVEQVDSIAKLVTALAKLIDAKTKADQVIKPADLARFVEAMTSAVNAHVAAPEERERVQRAWRRAAEEMAG